MDKIHSDGKESGARIVEAIEAVDCILAKDIRTEPQIALDLGAS